MRSSSAQEPAGARDSDRIDQAGRTHGDRRPAAPRIGGAVLPLALVTGARSIIGSYMGSGIPEDDIRDYAELYLQGKLPIEKLISGSIALDQVNEAMDTFKKARSCAR